MIIDLTLSLDSGMGGFPGYPSVEFETIQTYDEDDKLAHYVGFPTHQGTHVDAPAHFVEGGQTVDELDPTLFWGRARVVDLRDRSEHRLTADVLEEEAPELEADRVLLLTGDVDARFGNEDFFDEASVLTADAADWLLDRDVSIVANDFLTESIDNPDRPVHNTLLGAGVPIVEYLCNADAIADFDTVEFSCPPIRLAGLEAAPARALVRK